MNKKRQKDFQINWDDLANDLVNNCNAYHKKSYGQDAFTGPSHHFHLRALNANGNEKIEMTYAMLVSWGMHRMGGGAKMKGFKDFSNAISLWLEVIKPLEGKSLAEISESDIDRLKPLFEDGDESNMGIMMSSKKIVAISKVLAHYVPNIIAPIDNEYTIQFINSKPSKTQPRNLTEFELFKAIHLNLFKKVVSNPTFIEASKEWLNDDKYYWDTSLLKIVDNLIIAKVKDLKENDPAYKKPKAPKAEANINTPK